uniref:Aminotransferase-like n=1 Tax=Oryza australiensis TaxID=4532 RepID=A0A1V1H975_9ORYZ|nr:aminotransferase -like [Oryza australiensis]
MASSSTRSDATQTEYPEHLAHQIAIPDLVSPKQFLLGPIDNLDPSEFINAETNRIPFRFSTADLAHWSGAFKSCPSTDLNLGQLGIHGCRLGNKPTGLN